MKRFLSLISLLLLFSLLAACGGSGLKPLPAYEELAKTLTDAGIFADELEAVDPDIAARLYGLSETSGVEIHCWCSSSGGTAEEFTLFVCQDDAALNAVKQSVTARLETQKRTFESYAPAEVPKLEGAAVRVRDRVLAVCVAADPERAAKLLDPYFPA